MEDVRPGTSVTSIISRLEITAIALALACAVLYVHGTAFQRAYLTSFGLSAEGFPLSADQAMMRGFEAYILLATRGIGKLVTVSALIFFVAVGAIMAAALFVDWILNRAWLRRISPRLTKWLFVAPGQKEAQQPVSDVVVAIATYFGVMALGLLVVLTTAAFAADSGRYKAELVRDACGITASGSIGVIAWGISAPAVLVQYEEPGTPALAEVKGCVIATAPAFIALYEKPNIVTIPNARVVAIKAQAKQ